MDPSQPANLSGSSDIHAQPRLGIRLVDVTSSAGAAAGDLSGRPRLDGDQSFKTLVDLQIHLRLTRNEDAP